jgi:phosphohistidine phosphatase
MDLILWRHAEAEDGAPDSARKLTAKGRRQAARMAKWLAKRLPAQPEMIVSPAVRAQQTARALARRFDASKAVDVGADARSVLEAAGWPGADERVVVVVGHQPTLGEAAALALGGKSLPLGLKKGAVVWIESRTHDRHTEIVLRAAMSPDLL